MSASQPAGSRSTCSPRNAHQARSCGEERRRSRPSARRTPYTGWASAGASSRSSRAHTASSRSPNGPATTNPGPSSSSTTSHQPWRTTPPRTTSLNRVPRWSPVTNLPRQRAATGEGRRFPCAVDGADGGAETIGLAARFPGTRATCPDACDAESLPIAPATTVTRPTTRPHVDRPQRGGGPGAVGDPRTATRAVGVSDRDGGDERADALAVLRAPPQPEEREQGHLDAVGRAGQAGVEGVATARDLDVAEAGQDRKSVV